MVRCDDVLEAELASYLRIEERELEAGGTRCYFCAGDQRGWVSRRPAARVRFRRPLPSAFMTWMSLLPSRLLTNAIFRPSGDQ